MVVPFEGKAKIPGAGTIGSDPIDVAKGRNKIVDDQREQDGASAVAPQAVGVATRIVALLSEMDDKAFIGD